MANEEHLAILRQGIEAWNNWRTANNHIRPDLLWVDLHERYLSRIDLRGANLIGANLNGADLSWANLEGARLNSANLSGAYLSGANLSQSELMGADLDGADLASANLTGTNLRWAYISKTNLYWTDLSGADLNRTVFADVDLSAAIGLDQILHAGPSTIGIDTIYRSQGDIPEQFLKGAGVPDQFIAYVRSLVDAAIEYYSAFISHSSVDNDLARRLHNDLQNENVRCWFAPEDLKIGEKFRAGIDQAIRLHDKLLLILSRASVNSDWVEHEVESALEKEQRHGETVLFPVRIDDAIMEIPDGWPATIRRTRHIGDFRQWKNHDTYQQAFRRLLRDLKKAS